ncbi:SDR family NAD(P)-dependent oxidoreductase [Sandaracinobacteroides saxicola]|uniref:SDR family oxidoreductase n=1 Tax=Sandaracinobacteroides saxicola TaxID=2759707 RepID=A0A7G5ILI2_9SPHN|nr:SDR family NAD(P)-dependent oxidoreductase [Sandaracinobacteroides saxicola]QMW24224.1 SDR family oxidoreductase [Sandaracinobacteroides saxicola]
MTKALFDLEGHVALVTGGNGGLGLAMAKGLSRCGASIAIWGRSDAKNAAACAELGASGATVRSYIADVTDPASSAAAFERTIDDFGTIHSCFANAGGSGARGPFGSSSAADWNGVIALNLTSVVDTFRLATRHWQARAAGGKLIVTSSIAAALGLPMAAGYCTTKAAVSGLVRALAVELGPAGIRANAILPGFIETEMSLKTPQAFQDACRRRAVSGEIGKLSDMEGIAVYLASPASDFMTGQSIVLDGGHSIFPF